MVEKPKCSIVLPTYNEANNIKIIINELIKLLEKNYVYEIIVIDDNSPDHTWRIVEEEYINYQNIFCFRRIKKRGLSSAIVDGFMLSKFNNMIVLDSDLQHDLKIIPNIIDKLSNNFDLVIGSRYINNDSMKDWNFFRRLLSQFATKISNFIQDSITTDPMSGFFGIKKKLFLEVVNQLDIKGYKILLDIVAVLKNKKNFKNIDIPYKFKERIYGESKLTGEILIESLDLIYSKLFGSILPVNFIKFITVGSFGALIHFSILFFLYKFLDYSYSFALICSIEFSIIFNYFLNNIWTFRFVKLFGKQNLIGLIKFNLFSGIGGIIAYLVSQNLYNLDFNWVISSLLGAIVASLWNYNLNKIMTWRVN